LVEGKIGPQLWSEDEWLSGSGAHLTPVMSRPVRRGTRQITTPALDVIIVIMQAAGGSGGGGGGGGGDDDSDEC